MNMLTGYISSFKMLYVVSAKSPSLKVSEVWFYLSSCQEAVCFFIHKKTNIHALSENIKCKICTCYETVKNTTHAFPPVSKAYPIIDLVFCTM